MIWTKIVTSKKKNIHSNGAAVDELTDRDALSLLNDAQIQSSRGGGPFQADGTPHPISHPPRLNDSSEAQRK